MKVEKYSAEKHGEPVFISKNVKGAYLTIAVLFFLVAIAFGIGGIFVAISSHLFSLFLFIPCAIIIAFGIVLIFKGRSYLVFFDSKETWLAAEGLVFFTEIKHTNIQMNSTIYIVKYEFTDENGKRREHTSYPKTLIEYNTAPKTVLIAFDKKHSVILKKV
ncbi:MAG: hypothetical protein FWC82_03055 [Firmicutes bacterium]|nr:hypothetical protein [Bacillota bacterium]